MYRSNTFAYETQPLKCLVVVQVVKTMFVLRREIALKPCALLVDGAKIVQPS